MLHSCGHCVSYKDVLRLRNSIGQKEISRFLNNDNCCIPRQLVPDRFIQFAADNIDILEETLDKSPTFHGTQIVAFQNGPANKEVPKILKFLPYRQKLEVPESFHKLHKINVMPNKILPLVTNKNYILQNDDEDNFMFTYNLLWTLCRAVNYEASEEKIVVPQWSGFGKLLHQDQDAFITTYGYLPLLPYVSSEYDTIWTTMTRCNQIARNLNMQYTIITFDQEQNNYSGCDLSNVKIFSFV